MRDPRDHSPKVSTSPRTIWSAAARCLAGLTCVIWLAGDRLPDAFAPFASVPQARAEIVEEKGSAESKKLRLNPVTAFEGFPDWVSCVSFSPDGSRLAAGSYGIVRVFDLKQKQEVATLREPAGFVKSLA
jgi:WD40 repeat protein